MRFPFSAAILLTLVPIACFAQNDPLPVISSGWQRTVAKGKTIDGSPPPPIRAVTADNKNFRRNQREQTTTTLDPNDMTEDGRSAAIEKAVQQSRTPKTGDINGYTYSAEVKNNTSKKIDVVYWEYRFTEIANPANVIRRQFLCAAELKGGGQRQLTAFTTLGPTDVVDAKSLEASGPKRFDEEALVNRIEFADGAVLQRADWRLEDVKKSVERVTSTKWTNEVCRAL